ncbi:MAG: hypothetical protein FOGNACKC_02582 [Anaerolineae bacterium]|nr:hypothetical protein [Anaerolineae bacterium]
MKIRSVSPSFWAGVLVLLAAALLYLATLDNGFRPDELLGGDLITHQYAQVEARPSNAPGYPLYTMGGWLWFHAARGPLSLLLNPIQVLSFYSTLWGLASLLLLYLILLRVTANRWLLAALLTAFHAVTYFFWYYSVTTEQYTSATFQTLLLIWLALKWDEQPRNATLLGLAAVSGSMLANMVTTLFILPPLLWFIFFKYDGDGWYLTRYFKQPRLVLQAVAAAMLPLLAYAYIFVRGAQHPEWRGQGQWPSAWAWFVQFITIQQGRDELAPGLSLTHLFTAEFPGLMWRELTLLVFIGGLLGLVFLGRRRAIFLASTLVIYAIFCAGYRFGNWFQVIIPAYPIFTIGFGALLAALSRAARHRARAGFHALRYVDAVLAVLLLGLLLAQISRNWPRANQRNLPGDTGLQPGWAILADRPSLPALIAADFEERVALQYLVSVWAAAPGLTPVEAGTPLAGPQNLYITRRAATAPDSPNLAGRFPQAAGVQLIALPAEPPTRLPPQAQPSNLDFDGQINLLGWEQGDSAAGWQIALYWQAALPPTADFTVSVRPLVQGQAVTATGEAVIQDHQPVWGLYPTSRWQPGVVVRDVYAPALPAGVTPDAVQIVVYRATDSGFENLADHVIDLAGSSP